MCLGSKDNLFRADVSLHVVVCLCASVCVLKRVFCHCITTTYVLSIRLFNVPELKRKKVVPVLLQTAGQ